MQKIIICIGVPASGKTTFSQELLKLEPNKWQHINNDSLRAALNFSNYSSANEKIVSATRKFLIRESLVNKFNIIIDNVNYNKTKEVVNIVNELIGDFEIIEKPFYITLEEAIERDSKRVGVAKVGADVISNFYKLLGEEKFKDYEPKHIKISNKKQNVVFNPSLPKAIIVDVDGTIADISHRNPYDTDRCDQDLPKNYVINLIKQYHKQDYQIIFCSGREEKFRDKTSEWIDKYVITNYKLYMRPNDSYEKDYFIKENIYNNHIKGKYNIEFVLDDRLQVCRLWHNKLNLNLLRVGDPDSNF